MTDFRGANAQFEEYAARLADKNKRIADLEASMRHAVKIEDALRGIVNHWYEFGEMMIENRTDYGLDERIEAASKLVR